MAGDLDMLIDMGFDKERAEIAIKKAGDLQGAIDWLEQNQDKSLDDIKAEQAESSAAGVPDVESEAKSLVCDECGKKFRSATEAQFHATKSEHTSFSQSTDEIAPLTEEEKKAKLVELREKLAAKRAGQSEQDKLDRKKNEEIRRKATKETQDIKEDLQKKEQIKEAQKKKREKQEEVEARKRVQAKIEADKQARREKAEREKALRAGQAPPASEPATTPAAATSSSSKSAADYTEARLRLQTPGGTMMKTFPADTTLFEVAHAIAAEKPEIGQVSSFTQNFPKKVFDSTDFGQTLREAGMVPSSALIVK